MNEFLNPKSMFTPGVAGSFVMMLANTLCAVFPELGFRYVVVIASFLVALALQASSKLGFTNRALFWVLNSLVIFTVGVGASNTAANLASPPPAARHADQDAPSWSAIADLLVPAALAADEPDEAKLREEVERLRRENEQLRAETQQQQSTPGGEQPPVAAPPPAPPPPPSPEPSERSGEGFFKRW